MDTALDTLVSRPMTAFLNLCLLIGVAITVAKHLRNIVSSAFFSFKLNKYRRTRINALWKLQNLKNYVNNPEGLKKEITGLVLTLALLSILTCINSMDSIRHDYHNGETPILAALHLVAMTLGVFVITLLSITTIRLVKFLPPFEKARREIIEEYIKVRAAR